MFGLGKKRSRFGKQLDRSGVDQIQLEKESGLSRGTISNLCNDDKYSIKGSTETKVRGALKRMGLDDRRFFG
ncbi:transcriptional regulator [Alkalicoccobacillus porphyridii]|uniref:Transcriptional regulator n=1 Tax=Alkalicoccobacillus porphyridii TaxID=2597270 RepID=A0A553ZTX1_9BACI|nr:transcriptional regulator [Alkalicoccobacillus porphyridii]TSB44917.1 transcriptional regulator [Alkalicoccobacillus porphyridii]